MPNTNAFEQLCEIGAQQGFCWQCPCSTCANTPFHTGLIHIALNRPFPQSNASSWRFPRDAETVAFDTRRTLKPEPRERLINTLTDAKLSRIRASHHHAENHGEDWLGYLGVVLYRFDWQNDEWMRFGTSWKIQMNEIVDDPLQLLPPSPITFKQLEEYEHILLL